MASKTWSELYQQMREDLVTGNWRTKSYEFDGIKTEYISPKDFLDALDRIEQKAREESGGTVRQSIAGGVER